MSSQIGNYGRPKRGITESDVSQVADALFRAGMPPTLRNVRERLGSGAFNTIGPYLREWWKKLSSRLDSGPKAVDRLPESIAHIAEALWLQALEEARTRLRSEAATEARVAADTRQAYEVRSHVLSLREGEMQSRLDDKAKELTGLQQQLDEFKTLWRKERESRASAERQVDSLRAALLLTQEKSLGRQSRPRPPEARLKAATPLLPRRKRSPGRRSKSTPVVTKQVRGLSKKSRRKAAPKTRRVARGRSR